MALNVENGDDPTDRGEIVEDFTPTTTQRNDYGLELFLTFEIAAMYGVYRRRNHPDSN
jgi:hypothetical protein